MAAMQLAALQYSPAALRCRGQLASAERLLLPAISLFHCLSQRPAASQAFFPYTYLSGWATLLYLAAARRLPLRMHLLLVMPELCMQAAAAATPLCSPDRAAVELAGVGSVQVQKRHLSNITDWVMCQQDLTWPWEVPASACVCFKSWMANVASAQGVSQ